MIPVSMVVYWMMIFWLKQSDTCVSMVVYWMMIFWLKQSDTCVNGGLLNDDILIKTKLPELKWKWYLTNVSIVVYWMMIFWLKQSDTWKLKQSDTDKCVNSGLLNDDILIKTKWYLTKWYLTCVNSGLLIDDILIKAKWYLCQWWFIEWWYFD